LQKTSRRGVISPEERLAVTLSFFASGTPYRRFAYSFRSSNQASSYIAADTCAVFYDVLMDKYLGHATC
ncbi:nuclease HARBI1-like protein, partial [Aphelenchoides avenae]